MIIGVALIVISLLYAIVVSTIYFTKKRVDIFETRIYSILLILSLVGLTNELLCCFSVGFLMDILPITNIIITRFFLLVVFSWMLVFTIYICSISDKEITKRGTLGKKNTRTTAIVSLIVLVLLCVLPLEYMNENGAVYSYGIAANFLILTVGVMITICVISLIINFKTVKLRKYMPVIALVVIASITMAIRIADPSILVISTLMAFVTNVMYFTIENPDIKMIEQLNIAREQADKANSAKSEFLSSMSHEIRTPLNAIVGFSQALCEEELNDQARDEVNDIMMASETLLDIVNGILDISKIEANKLEIVNTEYSLNQIFDELVSLSKARLGEKPLDFRYDIDPSLPKYFYGDKVRVKQVILNLLTNSIKYTHEGWIEFKITGIKSNDVCRIIISVEDSGIGIKPESIDKLFSKFERLDIEKNNTIEGTGLGLAITKKLIDLMGGKIVVQSVYGQGSKFTIALDQKIVENPTIEIDNTKNIDVTAIKTIDLTNKRILVVDDNKVNLKVASRLLQDYHCIIDTLDSGQACIDKINFGALYDLILMDDMMPKMSGVETFHKLKEIEGFNTPVIALTANAISGMKEKYLSEGFNDYLSKPIDKGELNKILNKFLG